MFTGSSSFSVPIATSSGRNGFGPSLSAHYSSGTGNGIFGTGWSISIPSITRKTAKGLPKYTSEDVFILSGSEDLIPRSDTDRRSRHERGYEITSFRPRTEGLFAIIEKWELIGTIPPPGLSSVFWKVVTKDNITNFYGRSTNATISNPSDSNRIFQWFLEASLDPVGNYVKYIYKPENDDNIPSIISETNRLRCQKYIKKIIYGNLNPVNTINLDSYIENFVTQTQNIDEYMFFILFDYGEHGQSGDRGEEITLTIHNESSSWECREDPFSSFTSGFEIRTYRLCRRVLVFHNLQLSTATTRTPLLIKSSDFRYKQNSQTRETQLSSVTQRGYKRVSTGDQVYESEELSLTLGNKGVSSNHYQIKSMPRLEFTYTEFDSENHKLITFNAIGDDMPYKSLKDPNFALVDLFGSGLLDVVETTPNGYYYWRNLGDGLFDRRNILDTFPPDITLDQVGVEFGDMTGNGRADLLVHQGNFWGYYESSGQGGWSSFIHYAFRPSLDFTEIKSRKIDLTGNGKTDILLTEDRFISYFPNNGKDGFGEVEKTHRIFDLEQFPDVYFQNPLQLIHLADMNGDGLKDIVLVNDGRIDYWSSKGYGEFGSRVTMDNSPHFEKNFNPQFLFFIDINGNGPADIVYVASGKVFYWLNQSGNSWSEQYAIIGTPPITPNDSVQPADMLGNGMTGLLWSLDYDYKYPSTYLFLDITGGKKPNLLTKLNNNMGKETHLSYKPSTFYYLEDLRKGDPWLSSLPFPVQVLEKIEIIDNISQTRLVTSFFYHHGHYDGEDREFRGFARVEQLDTEDFHIYYPDPSLANQSNHVAPILTKTWYHTGVYRDHDNFLSKLRKEYFSLDGDSYFSHFLINSGDDERSAYRALRGALLREEVYALDETSLSSYPFSVSENGYQISLIQEKGQNRSGIFYSSTYEQFNYLYERVPDDPRITQKIIFNIDAYGNPLQSLKIAYPRRDPLYEEQGAISLVLDERSFINHDNVGTSYFVGINYQYIKSELLLAGTLSLPILPSVITSILSTSTKNVFSNEKYYFDGPPFVGLPLGSIGDTGLITRKENLVLTQAIIDEIYVGKIDTAELITLTRFVESPIGSGNFWLQSQQRRYGPSSEFHVLRYVKDPMGNQTSYEYDKNFLLLERKVEPRNTITQYQNDYINLRPHTVIDENLNRYQVVFDPLGLVIKEINKGKESQQIGDTSDFPTAEVEYNFFEYWHNFSRHPDTISPNYIITRKRTESYHSNPAAHIQTEYSYYDGSLQVIQNKIQAEPHPETGEERWVGSGWSLTNNKGWIIKEYEPYFTSMHEFEIDSIYGISSTKFYDAVGRTVRIENPNGTFSKVEFGPWHQRTFDLNDTAFESEWYRQMSSGSIEDKYVADTVIGHYNTPVIIHYDILGRSFLSIEHDGSQDDLLTRTQYDIQDNAIRVFDPRGNRVFEHKYDLLKNVIFRNHADSGSRTLLLNSVLNTVRKWNSKNQMISHQYDVLNRITHKRVTNLITNQQKIVEKIIYGEDSPNPEEYNRRQEIFKIFDGGGEIAYNEYDYMGHLLSYTRKILKNYKVTPDWGVLPDNEPTIYRETSYTITMVYDSLDRISRITTPDSTIYTPNYNIANLIETIDVDIMGTGDLRSIVRNINYNEKGQRSSIELGNNALTKYQYHPLTFRLISLETTKGTLRYQKSHFSFDPVGNIVLIKNIPSSELFFQNIVANSNREFKYDALYALTYATGRELLGNNEILDHEDGINISEIPFNNSSEVIRYKQYFEYDRTGNISEVRHEMFEPNGNPLPTPYNEWRRRYVYDANSNKLVKTLGGHINQPDFDYTHDEHGNHIDMPHIDRIEWDYRDQIKEIHLKNGQVIYFQYDSKGKRIIRSTENDANEILEEKLSISYYEELNKYEGINHRTKTEYIHFFDDKSQRIAIMETKKRVNFSDITPQSSLRYNILDHLQSSTVELDDQGDVITYEEYYPIGSTSIKLHLDKEGILDNNYRFSGKERDRGSNLYYFGSRYYIPWLGRWLSCDPAGEVGGLNSYSYVNNKFIIRQDISGQYDPAAFGDRLEGYIDVAQEAYMVEDTGLASSLWNTFVATTADVVKGTTSILKVGT
ncbi:MAG: SpvB/TcaC N-terminal domain-containing protein, partial [Candidatus Kariarchaeaceae archaeon]